ncbi:MAG: hypothetical protein PSX36_10550 [bacterium]|nr:hypothetical protein [bacterium]
MANQDKILRELTNEVNRLTKENEYLKSPLYHWDIIESIKGSYSVLLNPPLVAFNTTINQKASGFKININDIVCILSDGKTKWIYFNRKQQSVDGKLLVSDKLSFTGNIEEFLLTYDKPKVHLCQISRSEAVNLNYYQLNSKVVQLLGKNNPQNSCNTLTMSPNFKKEFIERKAALENIISFQKIQFRGI